MTEENTGSAGRVVVGVDGSPCSAVALRWARRLAELSGTGLDVVTAWEPPFQFGWSEGFAYLPEEWDPHAEAEKLANTTIDEVFGSDRPGDLRVLVAEGDPVTVLLEHSRAAIALVVGSRGHGRFAAMLLGSTSTRCAEHATCPVLVVHGEQPPP